MKVKSSLSCNDVVHIMTLFNHTYIHVLVYNVMYFGAADQVEGDIKLVWKYFGFLNFFVRIERFRNIYEE